MPNFLSMDGNLEKTANSISIQCVGVLGVCGSICSMLSQPITSAILHDNQPMPWENQINFISSLNWTDGCGHMQIKVLCGFTAAMGVAFLLPLWGKVLS
jgi:hypothetical protein